MRLIRRLAPLALTAAAVATPITAATAAPTAGTVVSHDVQTFFSFNDCNQQTLSGQGKATIVSRVFEQGFRFQVNGHYTAVDTAGNEYEATVIIRFTSDSDVTLDTSHQVFISKGSAPNEDVIFRVGTNPNGDQVEIIASDCHG
jgi:hypothetical protein